jgi:hypothetical protein
MRKDPTNERRDQAIIASWVERGQMLTSGVRPVSIFGSHSIEVCCFGRPASVTHAALLDHANADASGQVTQSMRPMIDLLALSGAARTPLGENTVQAYPFMKVGTKAKLYSLYKRSYCLRATLIELRQVSLHSCEQETIA